MQSYYFYKSLQILDQGLNTIDILLIVDSFLENVPGSIVSGNTFNQTLNSVIENVRTNICVEDRLDEILHFPNKTASDWVHDELCNLTVTQFQNVFEIFLADFNTTGFLGSVSIVVR